ncbi:MAG: type II toxin-antitoxin system RelE family toxin [Elainellaceae cyanobacterium]
MTDSSRYTIRVTPLALQRLARITDPCDRDAIGDRIRHLNHEPETQGHPLIGKLFGYRSVKAANHCYRIVYRLEHRAVVVLMVEREHHNGAARTPIDLVRDYYTIG